MAQKVSRRQRLNALHEKCALAEKSGRDGTSNCEPRVAVVCGMTPRSARLAFAYGILMAKAGRTFWVMPKSTCQTSPRSGTLSVLLLVELPERSGGERSEIVVSEVVGYRDAAQQ